MDYGKMLKDSRGITFYHNDSAENDIAPLNSTQITFPISPGPPTSAVLTNSTTINYYSYDIFRISIFTFLAVMVATLLVIIIVKRIKKVLSTLSQESDLHSYETVASEDSLNPQDNLAFEHHVNVDALDVRRNLNRHNSEYDNYSDEDETDSSKDKPPSYEDPPPYSSVSCEA